MKLTTLLGMAAALVAIVTTAAKADVLADIQARNKLICGMSSNSAPWGYLDTKTQQVVGYEIDLCNMLGKKLGVPVELKEVSSTARVPEIMQGRVDLLAQLLTYSKERAEQVDFSGAYVNESFSFMVPDDSEIRSVDELAGKRIGVVAGSFLEPLIPTRVPTARVVAFEAQPANFMALQQGKVAGSAMRYSQAKALEVNGGADVRKLRALPGPLTTAASGFGIKKGEEKWKAYLDSFLTEDYETSGEGQVLFDKWLGKDSVYNVQRDFKFGQKLEQLTARQAGLSTWERAMDLVIITNEHYRGLILSGLEMTLYLFVCSWVLGMLLGVFLTLLRALELPPLTWLVAAYVEYHRNVPALIQLFIWYFGIASLLPSGINDYVNDHGAEIVFAIIAFSCNKAAFISEELRSGLRAIPATQMEAARSMGLGYVGAMRWVILPQAWRLALPALMGQTLFLFKLTSIAAAIGTAELTYEARHIENITFRIFETFSIITAIYVIGSFMLMWMGAYVAHRFRLRLK